MIQIRTFNIRTLLYTCVALMCILMMPSCKTSKTATTQTEVVDNKKVAHQQYTARVERSAPQATYLTAKVKMQLKSGGKDLSVNGNLKMKRNEVIQLAVRVMGFEVGRMEFTPTDVLVLDRINSRYIRAAYHEVSYLRNAGLDFNALQSLFWNKLFVPNTKTSDGKEIEVEVVEMGKTTALEINDAPKLKYQFQTNPQNARIGVVTITPKAQNDKSKFQWTYAQFEKFGDSTFPSQMKCQVNFGKRSGALTLNLSKIDQSSDWKTKTTVSSKYKKESVENILKQLLSL